MNVPAAADPYMWMVKMLNFLLWIFYHLLLKKKKGQRDLQLPLAGSPRPLQRQLQALAVPLTSGRPREGSA